MIPKAGCGTAALWIISVLDCTLLITITIFTIQRRENSGDMKGSLQTELIHVAIDDLLSAEPQRVLVDR